MWAALPKYPIKGMMRLAMVAVLGLFALSGLSSNAHAVCINPAGVEGEITYNNVYSTPQYCDNTNWIAMVGASGEPSTPGLVGHWKFDEGSGTLAADSSGNGNNATLAGGYAWETPGVVGGNIDFAGSNGRAEVTQNATINDLNSLTFMAWVKGVSGGGARLVHKDNDFYIFGTPTSNWLQFEVDWDGSRGQWRSPNNILDSNVWHHFAITYDFGSTSNDPVMYLDGEVIGSFTMDVNPTGNPTTSTDNLIIGNRSSYANDWQNDIDDVRLYNRALTANEIQEIFNATNSVFTQIVPSGLVGHWRLDETGGATTAVDSSGKDNNGTLSNASGNQGTVGVVSTGMKFGNGERLQVPADATINDLNQVSISAWAYSTWAGGGRLFFKSGEFVLFSLPSSDYVSFQAIGWSGSNGQWRTASNVLNDGEFNHIVVTYDMGATSNDPKVYVNNQLMPLSGQDLNPTGAVTTTSNDLYIGNSDTNNEWASPMDDFRLYNRILTPAEVTELYNARDGIHYNETNRVPEFFDGNRFVSMPPPFPDVTDGLVGHWKLDETTGTTAADSSGNGDDGTLESSMDLTTDSALGAIGTSLIFDGIDDNIDVTTSWSDLTQFSFSAWIRPDTWGDGQLGRIIHKGNNAANPPGGSFLLCNSGVNGCVEALRFEIGGSVGNGIWHTNNSITLGAWQHVVVTYDKASTSNDPSFYINGALQTIDYDNNIGGSFTADDNAMWIGSRLAGQRFFNGSLDDVRTYNRVLSAAEIQKLYNMGTPVGSSTALPQGCATVGDVCDDGTIYAGVSPDGSVAMFAMPYNTPVLPWNNDNGTGQVQTFANDVNSGASNTNTAVVIDSDSGVAGFQPHQILQYCYDLASHGADDWYVPARNEWGVMWDSLIDVDGDNDPLTPLAEYEYGFSNGRYFTSTESSSGVAIGIDTDTGTYPGNNKTTDRRTRCVRKGPAPRCASPYGLEGAMLYNDDNNVVQYCDGARWLAIGKDQ